MTDTTKEAVESMADYYNRWAHDIREMNGASVDADHADLTAATLRALVDENERLRADLANAVKVKPLEWEKDPRNVSFIDAEYVDDFGLYCIAERVLFIGHTETGIRFGTVKEAKAAAQADYERRILSAITTTDTLTDPLKAEREKALRGLLADKEARNSAFDAMWKVATETYSLEATNARGARYSITGDVINALWYAAILALIDQPTQGPD